MFPMNSMVISVMFQFVMWLFTRGYPVSARLQLRVLNIHHEQNPWLSALRDELCVMICGLVEPKAFASRKFFDVWDGWRKPYKDTKNGRFKCFIG